MLPDFSEKTTGCIRAEAEELDKAGASVNNIKVA